LRGARAGLPLIKILDTILESEYDSGHREIWASNCRLLFGCFFGLKNFQVMDNLFRKGNKQAVTIKP